jgi:PadR family transcriptional regulator, regulatory protein PadR
MGGRVTYLGEFEQVVLLAVVHLGDDAYGAGIRREIEARGERTVTIGAVYATLDRLADKGYLRTHDVPGGAERGGHPRRNFSLTPAGVAALEAARALQARMWNGIRLPKGKRA